LIEVLLAMALTLAITSTLLAMLNPATGAFQIQPESADLQQRLRAASDVLFQDLAAAGAASAASATAMPASRGVASVFPQRLGRRSPDPPGTFSASRISLWSINPGAQTTLAAPLPSASGIATISTTTGCVMADPSCGFRSGMTVGVFDTTGGIDLFSVASVSGATLSLQHDMRDGGVLHRVGEPLLDVVVRDYFLKDDAASGGPQLARYDGADGSDVPVVDHAVQLRFDYFGDPDPPALVNATPPAEPIRTTYGPPPPSADAQPSAYPPGENCVFARGQDGTVVPRLPALGTGPGLVALPGSLLTDGPWCPDAASPNRYDADLLRIRAIVVTLRIEAAIAALRGPAGPLFTRAGTARGTRLVPDREVRLAVSPRALNGAR
jgi:hypothetical protein